MHSHHPEIVVEHEHASATVSFVAPVSESSIIHLVRTVNELRWQRFYRRVELQIASPGGDVLALQYFVEALAHWNDDGLELATRALTSCSSAAAVMLSLGHRRTASPASRLLYHFARVHVAENVPITGARAHQFAESLELTDTGILEAMVRRAVCHAPEADALSPEDRATLEELRRALGERACDEDAVAWLKGWLAATGEAEPHERHARWERLYRALCGSERSISGRLAHALGLVDALIEPMTHERAEAPAPARSLVIPEWRSAYRGGVVDVRDLRRHLLATGESGSGKTLSAVLPLLAAAYRSPEVGVALVIDPKRDLGAELERLRASDAAPSEAKKRIVWIRPEALAIDLMSSDAWSIDGLIKDRRYWSAAERVLRRIAGLGASNPAQLLLGKPAPHRDAYWDREGVRLATAVLAMAIEWTVDWPAVAQMIKVNLQSALGRSGQRGWEAVGRCFARIHPDIVATNPTWREWIARVRAEYAMRFAVVGREVRDEDGRRRSAWVACEEAEPAARVGAEDVRYETCLLDVREEVDERGRYEALQWRQLRDVATSESQRTVVETMHGVYRRRVGDARETWKREREAVQRAALDGLSGDDVRPEMVRIVAGELPHGVGGRTEAQWRAVLEEALARRAREIVQASEAERARVPGPSGDPATEEDVEGWTNAMSAIAHDEAQALEQALPALVVEALSDAGGEAWETLVDRARTERVRDLGAVTAFGATTTFLDVLEGFDKMMGVIEGAGVAGETPNLVAVADILLEELFSVGDVQSQEEHDAGTTTVPTGAQHMAREMSGRGGEWEKTAQCIARFAEMRNSAAAQYSGCLSHAASTLYEFSRPEVERVLYFGCEPGLEAKRAHGGAGEGAGGATPGSTLLDFREAVANRAPSPGVMYVYQPSRHRHDELIARACKMLFFEAVLDSAARREAGQRMPLAGYVADEFQRFITADPVHGEQSYLDVCRSFGAFAVLACQSVASLRYALCELEGDPDKRNSAIDIICNNTATKLFFRTTDEETARRARTVSPILSDGRTLIDSRPLSSLRPGECYASFPDGRFERIRIGPYAQAHPREHPGVAVEADPAASTPG